jgi:glutamate synthase (NADPH/NADH) small chain
MWSVMTKRFSGVEIRVSQLECCRAEWVRQPAGWKLKELPGTDFILPADLVILALGFEHVVHDGLIKELGLKLDERGNVAVYPVRNQDQIRPKGQTGQGFFSNGVNNYQTSERWVFAAGDTINGASLVVTAISSGREAAAAIDRWLKEA